jgi:hypothetical protein
MRLARGRWVSEGDGLALARRRPVEGPGVHIGRDGVDEELAHRGHDEAIGGGGIDERGCGPSARRVRER